MPVVKIVTLNLLSDLETWAERRSLVVQGLAALGPDLVALQEVNIQAETASWLAEQLKYEHVALVPKTGKEREKEGIAILSRLPFEAADHLDLLTQDRVAQYVLVQVEGKRLALANGHFYWQPGESQPRMQQVERLLAWLEAIPGTPQLVVCGDFNATPDTGSIQRMYRSFASAYKAIHGLEPEYTAPTGLRRSKMALLGTLFSFIKYIHLSELRLNWRGTLDYIFVSRQVKVIDCQLAFDQPSRTDAHIYPSDHFGLTATLEF